MLLKDGCCDDHQFHIRFLSGSQQKAHHLATSSFLIKEDSHLRLGQLTIYAQIRMSDAVCRR
jgi:hypothetical protein